MAITANNPPLDTTQRPINWGAVFLFAILSITADLGSHAYLQHREHAKQARNCVQHNGVWKGFLEMDGERFQWFCRDPMTVTILDRIVEKETNSVRGKDHPYSSIHLPNRSN
jgi:hypothetical protein